MEAKIIVSDITIEKIQLPKKKRIKNPSLKLAKIKPVQPQALKIGKMKQVQNQNFSLSKMKFKSQKQDQMTLFVDGL